MILANLQFAGQLSKVENRELFDY